MINSSCTNLLADIKDYIGNEKRLGVPQNLNGGGVTMLFAAENSKPMISDLLSSIARKEQSEPFGALASGLYFSSNL